MALDPTVIEQVLKDPDVAKIMTEQIAEATFKSYKEGVRKGMEMAHQHPRIPLAKLLEVLDEMEQEDFQNEATTAAGS